MPEEAHASSGLPAALLEAIEVVAVAVELLAIGIIVVGIVLGTLHYWRRSLARTVALDPTPQAIAVLGLLVLIRTFLSWTLVVEEEGRWPWQPRGPAKAGRRYPGPRRRSGRCGAGTGMTRRYPPRRHEESPATASRLA